MSQNFFIKKNSELPILQMKVINDGRNDYKKIFDNLENAAITFSMKEVDCNTCKYKVFNKQALVIPVENEACGVTEYYIGYKFTKNETNMAGTFKAEFKIDFSHLFLIIFATTILLYFFLINFNIKTLYAL